MFYSKVGQYPSTLSEQYEFWYEKELLKDGSYSWVQVSIYLHSRERTRVGAFQYYRKHCLTILASNPQTPSPSPPKT